MADVERHEFFPTCIYRFKHDFKENELNMRKDMQQQAEEKLAITLF